MITAVKDILSVTLKSAGISENKIARNAREEQSLISRKASLPIASLVTNPGRFEACDHKEIRLRIEGKTLYRQVRTKRVMSVVVKITAQNEIEAGSLINGFIVNLPFFWEFQGIVGQIEPTHEQYSDYDSQTNPRYEAAVSVEFSMDVGPEGTSGETVSGVNEGSGVYEARK